MVNVLNDKSNVYKNLFSECESHFFKDKEFLIISLDPVMENIILAVSIVSPEPEAKRLHTYNLLLYVTYITYKQRMFCKD